MKLRLLISFLALSPVAALSQAYFGVNGWCTVGAQATVTQGLSSAGTKPISGGTFSQNSGVLASYPKCTITVYATGTANISTIYSNVTGNALSNPFTGNTDGSFLFFGLAGCYDIVTSSGVTTGSTMPANKTYTDVCIGTGSGGNLSPGTPYEVTRYDPSGLNIQNSRGSDNPANGPTQWPSGLNVIGDAGYLQKTIGAGGILANQLVEYDGSGNAIVSVTSSTNVRGIAHFTANSGGSDPVAIWGSHNVLVDNQTTVNDFACPSSTTPGFATDVGATQPTTCQIIGKFTSVNTGVGTLALIELPTAVSISPGSSVFATCTNAFSNAFFLSAGANIACDHQVTDDGVGNMSMKSDLFTDTRYAMFIYYAQGPLPPATPANTRMDTVPTSVTAHTVIHPSVPGTAGQAEIVSSTFTDANGNVADVMTWGSAGGGVTYPPAANPSIPVVTNGGTPGAATYCYVVTGNQDGASVFHSKASAQGCTTTGNATLTISNFNLLKAYADTLYGYRCYDISRVTGGATQGNIATCAGKAFKDTGLAGNGATAPSTNNTELDPTGLLRAGNACNSMFHSAEGIDAPPCSPTLFDNELTNTWDSPGGVSDGIFTLTNHGSETWAWTGGTISVLGDSVGGANYRFQGQSLSGIATPYTIVTYLYFNSIVGSDCSLALRESGTGKLTEIGIQQNQGLGGAAGGGLVFIVRNWTNTTTVGSTVNFQNNQSPAAYLYITNDGTNLTYKYSYDGLTPPVTFLSQTVVTAFTTAPDQAGVSYSPAQAVAAGTVCKWDYLRQ